MQHLWRVCSYIYSVNAITSIYQIHYPLTSDTNDRTVSPATARSGVLDIVSGTEGPTGTESVTDEIIALVNELVTNVYASENSK